MKTVLNRIWEIVPREVFLLGDQRNTSADSRYPEIGTVKTERILGKVGGK